MLNEFSAMNNELVNLQRQLTKSNAELKRTKEEAVRANDLKSTFLAVVSHEFRTPMNGILGMIEMLGSSKLSPDQRQAIGVHSHFQAILVAEDNRVNRQVVQLQLNHLGFQHIDFAEDGQAAVRAASERSYACILMDHHMPLLNGHDAAKAIRQREAENQQPPVPIISLTGNVSEEDQARGREVGVNDYLMKPVTIEKLSEKLVKWLPKPEAEPILDEEVIREIMLLDEDGSTGLLESLIEMYTSDTPAKIKKLNELAAAGEATKVVEAAHELKSGSVSLGVGRLSSLLSDIEQLARENRLENAKAKLSALQSVYQATCLELEHYIHRC
ncbi:response regulator [Paenibacillus sp. TY11]|uniref:response regulator n=1 Tax=Paenibacillus sp. TY11 TaxID=3448633 RepID=UPI004038FE13